MALSKVGAAPFAGSYNIPENGTLDVVFTPDTTWTEGDVLVGLLSWGAMDDNQTFTALLQDDALDWEAGTQFILDVTAPSGTGWEFTQNTLYWAPFYHTVTSGEAGAGTITLTATLTDISTVDGSAGVDPGYIICAGGVAVRGGDMPTTGVNIWVPFDNSDTDNVLNPFGVSPQVASFNGPLDGYSDGEVGQLLLYVHSMGTNKDKTASSRIWTGPTELTDGFVQNGIETGATDIDVSVGLAYALLGATDDWPAGDEFSHSWAGGAAPNSTYAVRMGFGFLSSVPVVEKSEGRAPFEYVPSRVNVTELPHSVHTGMV